MATEAQGQAADNVDPDIGNPGGLPLYYQIREWFDVGIHELEK